MSHALQVHLWSHDQGYRELGAHALDFSTVKSIASPAGQWSVSLDGDSVDAFGVGDDDWIGLVVEERLRRTQDLVVLGLVDGARRSWRADTDRGSPTRTARLAGRDFGKAFETHEILFDPHLQFAEPLLPGLIDPARFASLVDLIHTGQQVPPAQTAFDLLGILIGDGWYYAPSTFGVRSLTNTLAVEATVFNGNVVQLGTYVPEGAQKLDPYLRSLLVTPFTELFYDLRPVGTGSKLDLNVTAGAFLDSLGVQPTVVFRPLPFYELDAESDAWFNLDLYHVAPSEVLDEDLGRSGSERFTLFSARAPIFAPSATMALWGSSGGRIPAFEHEQTAGRRLATEVARHGVRLLDVTDGLAPLVPSAGLTGELSPSLEWLAARTAALYQLYRATPSTVSGTLRLAHLRPEIRIGCRVQYDGREYYVHQVEHSGSVDPRSGLLTGQTSLTLVRGQPYDPVPTAEAPRPWRTRVPR